MRRRGGLEKTKTVWKNDEDGAKKRGKEERGQRN